MRTFFAARCLLLPLPGPPVLPKPNPPCPSSRPDCSRSCRSLCRHFRSFARPFSPCSRLPDLPLLFVLCPNGSSSLFPIGHAASARFPLADAPVGIFSRKAFFTPRSGNSDSPEAESSMSVFLSERFSIPLLSTCFSVTFGFYLTFLPSLCPLGSATFVRFFLRVVFVPFLSDSVLSLLFVFRSNSSFPVLVHSVLLSFSVSRPIVLFLFQAARFCCFCPLLPPSRFRVPAISV